MGFYLSLPFLFIKFWFLEAPVRLAKYFSSLNHAALQILSLKLLLTTFFKPLKNEYRKGLVGFSIGMGIIVKSILIIADLFILSFLLWVEVLVIAGFILWPFASFYLFFI